MSKRVKSKTSVFTRITLIIVLCLFVMLAVSMFITLGLSSIIASTWNLDENNVFMFGLIVLVISIVLGMGLSVAYSALIVKASKPYLNALQKIAEGDFSVRIKDSLVFANLDIAKNFNHMVDQLASVETLRENFVSDFSHEFKTPIVSIAGFAKLLKSPALTAEQRNEYLDVIIDESNRLVELSESVLLLNRLESQPVVTERYALDEQLRQCVLMFEQQSVKKNVAIEVDLQPITVNTSYKLMSQVVVNLLSNALKFTPEGGSVTVKCKTEKSHAVITVTDTGCGMDDEVRSNIFNKFYQGDKSHTTSGNGLGLSIVKKIVDLLGAEIYVSSQVGVGSTFTVALSREQSVTNNVVAARSAANGSAPSKN